MFMLTRKQENTLQIVDWPWFNAGGLFNIRKESQIPYIDL